MSDTSVSGRVDSATDPSSDPMADPAAGLADDDGDASRNPGSAEAASRLDPVRRMLPTASAVEAGAISAAAIALILGFIVGYLLTGGAAVPVSGSGSLGANAAVTGALISAGAFLWGYFAGRVQGRTPRQRRAGRLATVVDLIGLTFTHAALTFMLVLGASYVVQQAFVGAVVFALAAGFLTAAVAAVAAYFSFLSAAGIDAGRVATLLAVFLVSGALTSMLSASDPAWWEKNISALGTARDFSGYAFDLTVIIGGLVLTTLSRFIGGELDDWAGGKDSDAARGTRIVTWALVVIGICLAFVGIVPVDVNEIVHNSAATGMMLVFLVLVVALRWFLPGFPNAFLLLGYAFALVILISVLLFFPFGYYNLTAVELVAAALIFGWLVIFIRNVTAAASDRDRERTDARTAPERRSVVLGE